ncbi:hypothetical protein [Ferruginibacter sp.]
MPFICIFQLNNGAISNSDNIIFIEFIESAFGSFHQNPVRIAKIFYNGNKAYIYSNCPCFPSSKGEIKRGEIIDDKTKIAYFSTNGEDIPYNLPYATISKE